MDQNENGEEEPFVFIIIGGVRSEGETEMTDFHALLTAPDDDSAVRRCLEALASEGYEEANLDQIGTIDEPEEGDDFHAAYQAALSGDIALMIYESGSPF